MKEFVLAAALRALFAAVSVCAFAGAAAAQTASWVAQDIGAPALSGSTTFASGLTSGTFTIEAAGSDISGSSDQFHFAYQAVTGDVEIVARIDSLSPVSPWTIAGLMVRGSLAANAPHAFAGLTPSRGVYFRARPSAGANTSQLSGPAHTPPAWVRLVRQGTVVRGFASADGAAWTSLGSATVSLGDTVYVGLAVTSRHARTRTTAVASNVTLASIGLPPGLHSTDIGSPVLPGDVFASSGWYSITAAGAGIDGTADEFHFVYQPVTGNIDVRARVASIDASTMSARAGVTIRESLAAESRHATVALSKGNGYAFQRRLEPAATTALTAGGSGTPPGWVRLVRTGNLLEAYRSSDGMSWVKIAEDVVSMADTVYVGLAATSHSVTAPATSGIDNFSIIASAAPGNQPPAVSLVSPPSGTEVTLPATMTISAVASDPENRMLAVDFYADYTLLGRVTTSPYSVVWSPSAAGTYSLTAVAHDADGGSTTSSAVAVQVHPRPNTPPVVSLSTSGTTFTAPATITLSASASDADGHVAQVEFFAGGTRLGTVTAAPFAFTWSGVSAGAYSLTAVAHDNEGASTTSAPVAVTVSAPLRGAFGGTAVALPGVIQAENFDEGGPGVAYHDLTAGNAGGAYRNTDVDIEVTTDAGGGHNVGWIQAGEWLEYSVNVTTAGAYTLQARVASSGAGGTLHVQAKGVNLTGSMTVPDTGAWQTFQTLSKAVTLTAGEQVIRLAFDTAGPNGFVGNVNWLAFVRAPAAPSGLTAQVSTGGVTLNWTDNSTDETGFVIERQTGTGTFAVLTTVGSNVKSFVDTTVGAGTTYGYRVKAVNGTAESGYSNTATVTTPAVNKPPVVSLATDATNFTAPASITLTATASDPDGQIARVEFFNGSTRLNTDTTAPYSFTWSSVPGGTYTLTAVAYDNEGASATSAPVSVTVHMVSATEDPPRYVAFTASTDHATNVTKYVLKVYASTANPATATPLATSDLGKPTPSSTGEIVVDRQTFFNNLAAGSYLAVVTAVNSSGETPSASVAFSR
jgi:regulation of enolase protein 1 (concanavalin A-like superfamily)